MALLQLSSCHHLAGMCSYDEKKKVIGNNREMTLCYFSSCRRTFKEFRSRCTKVPLCITAFNLRRRKIPSAKIDRLPDTPCSQPNGVYVEHIFPLYSQETFH